MQTKVVYLLFCKFTLHVSGVNHTFHQEYTKTVTTAFGTGHIFCAATSLQRGQAWPRWKEVAAKYRRLYLHFCVLLMMGVIDTRNL